MLTTKLKPLLKLVAKGRTMHALLAKSGKQVVVMLSRKPIPPARRKIWPIARRRQRSTTRTLRPGAGADV